MFVIHFINGYIRTNNFIPFIALLCIFSWLVFSCCFRPFSYVCQPFSYFILCNKQFLSHLCTVYFLLIKLLELAPSSWFISYLSLFHTQFYKFICWSVKFYSNGEFFKTPLSLRDYLTNYFSCFLSFYQLLCHKNLSLFFKFSVLRILKKSKWPHTRQ